ncbi:MAG: AraC family transcriptional regulator [Bacteroides sp.]|nr:AraC family transcriptional regulator [Bacteroides sp.]
MENNKLYIKNMVCRRCILVVTRELERLKLNPVFVVLGEVILSNPLTAEKRQRIKEALHPLGFELTDSKQVRLIQQIKNSIIELIHQQNSDLKIKLSDYLAHKLHTDYSTLSTLFSETEGITLEKYFIAQKIERVKEPLIYDELTLSQIADLLHYSSTAHLSSQFKKVTGFTPSYFKQLGAQRRKPLDEV